MPKLKSLFRRILRESILKAPQFLFALVLTVLIFYNFGLVFGFLSGILFFWWFLGWDSKLIFLVAILAIIAIPFSSLFELGFELDLALFSFYFFCIAAFLASMEHYQVAKIFNKYNNKISKKVIPNFQNFQQLKLSHFDFLQNLTHLKERNTPANKSENPESSFNNSQNNLENNSNSDQKNQKNFANSNNSTNSNSTNSNSFINSNSNLNTKSNPNLNAKVNPNAQTFRDFQNNFQNNKVEVVNSDILKPTDQNNNPKFQIIGQNPQNKFQTTQKIQTKISQKDAIGEINSSNLNSSNNSQFLNENSTINPNLWQNEGQNQIQNQSRIGDQKTGQNSQTKNDKFSSNLLYQSSLDAKSDFTSTDLIRKNPNKSQLNSFQNFETNVNSNTNKNREINADSVENLADLGVLQQNSQKPAFDFTKFSFIILMIVFAVNYLLAFWVFRFESPLIFRDFIGTKIANFTFTPSIAVSYLVWIFVKITDLGVNSVIFWSVFFQFLFASIGTLGYFYLDKWTRFFGKVSFQTKFLCFLLGVFYAFNPWTFERFFMGQPFVLIGQLLILPCIYQLFGFHNSLVKNPSPPQFEKHQFEKTRRFNILARSLILASLWLLTTFVSIHHGFLFGITFGIFTALGFLAHFLRPTSYYTLQKSTSPLVSGICQFLISILVAVPSILLAFLQKSNFDTNLIKDNDDVITAFSPQFLTTQNGFIRALIGSGSWMTGTFVGIYEQLALQTGSTSVQKTLGKMSDFSFYFNPNLAIGLILAILVILVAIITNLFHQKNQQNQQNQNRKNYGQQNQQNQLNQENKRKNSLKNSTYNSQTNSQTNSQNSANNWQKPPKKLPFEYKTWLISSFIVLICSLILNFGYSLGFGLVNWLFYKIIPFSAVLRESGKFYGLFLAFLVLILSFNLPKFLREFRLFVVFVLAISSFLPFIPLSKSLNYVQIPAIFDFTAQKCQNSTKKLLILPHNQYILPSWSKVFVPSPAAFYFSCPVIIPTNTSIQVQNSKTKLQESSQDKVILQAIVDFNGLTSNTSIESDTNQEVSQFLTSMKGLEIGLILTDSRDLQTGQLAAKLQNQIDANNSKILKLQTENNLILWQINE